MLSTLSATHPTRLQAWLTRFVPPATFEIAPSPFPLPPHNLTAATGNTYKNVYEATTMSSGLPFVVLINIVVVWLAILFYRYVILREAGLLSPEEVLLLRKYPSVRTAQIYTPSDAFVRAAPPMRWTGWRDFFTASDVALSRDAQVYLLFQRACILTTAICALFASIILMPSYWLGGAVFETQGTHSAPHSLLSLLKSDRGIFERFTSHNLPPNSPLVMLQLPVFLVTALCIIVLYTVVKAAAGEERTVSEWLERGSSTSSAALAVDLRPIQTTNSTGRPLSARKSYWTLFARGLPRDLQSADELACMLDAIYPNQVVNVELVCKGRMSEARLARALSSARNRLDYLYDTVDDNLVDTRLSSETLFGRIFGLFAKKRTREELIQQLERKIAALNKDLDSRKNEPVRDFMGSAFISFRSADAAASVLSEFPVSIGVRYDSGEVHDGSFINSRIGRHSRQASEWAFPRLLNLYHGTINLLPDQLRQRVIASSHSATPHTMPNQGTHEQLEGSGNAGVMTPAIATSRLQNMKAERAPKSGDIIWENIGISFFERTVREMMVQVIVFAILILFTSPVAMLTALKLIFAELSLLSDPQMIFGLAGHHNGTSTPANLPSSLNETDGMSFLSGLNSQSDDAADSISQGLMSMLPSFLSSNPVLRSAVLAYLPVMMLAVIFAIVPSLLRLTCSLEGYPTQSAQEMSVFRKTSFYYVMNAVVLPSVALNTASEVLQMIYKQSNGGANVYNALPILQRLFSGDIAFFLCNYLVQLALTGSVFWLMRLPSSFSMMVRRRMALTPLEAAEAKCTDIFDYPRHYAYSVTVMSMCLLFGFMAPLIWWFALLYFVCKHTVDLYTIRYVHPKSHIDGRLPRLSTNFILIWTAVSQLSLALIFYLQGWVFAGIATALLCTVTLACCLSVQVRFGNRIMHVIAMLRDRAILNIMGRGSGEYGWMPSALLKDSSSSSSSTTSLAEPNENDALLIRHGASTGPSMDEREKGPWGSSIDESPPEQDDDLDIDDRHMKVGERIRRRLLARERLSSGTFEGADDGEDSEVEIDRALMVGCDVEDKRLNINVQYGSFETETIGRSRR